jgi:methionyl-tRNA formyltransferase
MAEYRLLFLGQKPFGEAAWQVLRDNTGGTVEVDAICTNARANDVWWKSNAIFNTTGGIPCIDNTHRHHDLLLAAIAANQINFILSVQHPWVLPKAVLQAVDYRAINFHNAKLPRYRGYNAINHAILNGDHEFTCTAHWMADEVDRGDVALEATFDLAADETALSLYAKCHHAGIELFRTVLTALMTGHTLRRRRPEGAAGFYARDSIAGLREVTDADSSDAERKARAFYFPPFEPAYVVRNNRKLYLLPEVALEGEADLRSLRPLHKAIQRLNERVKTTIV